MPRADLSLSAEKRDGLDAFLFAEVSRVLHLLGVVPVLVDAETVGEHIPVLLRIVLCPPWRISHQGGFVREIVGESAIHGRRPLLGAASEVHIAHVNMKSLACATARRREFAVRCSVGAGRMRLIRQMLAESILPALMNHGTSPRCGFGRRGAEQQQRGELAIWKDGSDRVGATALNGRDWRKGWTTSTKTLK